MALAESRPLPGAPFGGSSLSPLENARCDSQLTKVFHEESAELRAARVVGRRAPILYSDWPKYRPGICARSPHAPGNTAAAGWLSGQVG